MGQIDVLPMSLDVSESNTMDQVFSEFLSWMYVVGEAGLCSE